MIRRSITLTLLLCFALSFTACGEQQIIDNAQAVVDGAQSVVTVMSLKDPGSTQFQKAKDFVTQAQKFLDAYKNLKSPDANIALELADLISAFEVSIQPLISLGPVEAASIAGVNVALRVIAAHVHKKIAKSLASLESSKSGVQADLTPDSRLQTPDLRKVDARLKAFLDKKK